MVKGYEWLGTVGVLPKMVSIGLSTMGIEEIPGPRSRKEIMDWAVFLGLDKVYTNDDIAWCGLWMAYISVSSGRDHVKNPLWARNWQNWGKHIRKPELGAICVFGRGHGGHVGIYIAEDATHYHVLGGNQGNRVSIVRIEKKRLLAARIPEYRNKPASARPYIVAPNGTVSVNEA